MNLILMLLLAGQASGLEVGLKAVAPVGGQPAVVVNAYRPVTDAVVKLDRSDGKSVTLHTGRMKAGQKKELPLGQPTGKFHYQGKLSATYQGADGATSMDLDFDAVVAEPPQVGFDPEDVQLEDHRILVKMNREPRKVVFTIYGDNGEIVDRGEPDFKGSAAGEKLPLVFNPGGHKILRIDIVGHDVWGLFSPTLSLFPWSLDIPHQDVNFPTGESVIPKEELPKVQAAVQEIQQAAKRYGKVVNITLFVGGHTDTVGNPTYNQSLSEARAQSIAHAMRRAGVRVPIRFQGFGEELLAEMTPDETENARNRRATYTLSVQPPPEFGHAGGWKALP